MQSPQVLIVGAGPSGLILALSLLKNGIPVRIIEKRADGVVGDRGAGVMPRTLEIEHLLGIDEHMEVGGLPSPTVYVYDANDPYRVAKTVPLTESYDPTPAFPVSKGLILGQEAHQALVQRHIEALGGTVEFNTALLGVEQDDNGVTADISKVAGEQSSVEKVRFAYVVGADGARSTIRKSQGINFVGETRAQAATLLDTELEGLKDKNAMRFWGEITKAMVIVRNASGEGAFHVMFFGSEVDHAALLTYDAEAATKELLKVSNRPDLKITKIRLTKEWIPNIRLADRFRSGRIFIIGDAAHVHPPTGGQGLNSGIQDAFNLAWKLAMVLKGQARPSLLDSYEAERMPVIASMLKMTTNIFDNMQDRLSTESIERAVGENAKISWSRAGRSALQLDINYRWSDVVFDERFGRSEGEANPYGEMGHDFRAGDRAPDAPNLVSVGTDDSKSTRLHDIFNPTLHTAILFAPSASAPIAALLEPLKKLDPSVVQILVIVPKGAEATPSDLPSGIRVYEDTEGHAFAGYGVDLVGKGPVLVIVRPDGMIGAFALTTGGVEKYLTTVFKA